MKAYNKIGRYLILVFSILLTACSEIEYKYPYEAASDGKEISDFKIPSLGLTGKRVVEGIGDNQVHQIVVTVLRGFDWNALKNVSPEFTISVGSSISPAISQLQDFTQPVEYVITSEKGNSRKWIVKVVESAFITQGELFQDVSKLWYKTSEEMGLTANNENTIATLGNKIVVSRTGLIFDGETGTSAGVLNMTGINASANTAQNIPFVLTNDDAGNLLGCTLGAWSKPYFRVYRWTSLDNAPTEVLEYSSDAEEYGRKFSVVGDITKDGYINSYDYKSNTGRAQTAFWKVIGGTVDPQAELKTNWYNAGSLYQLTCQVNPDNIYPHYFCDVGHTAVTVLKYVYLDGTARKECNVLGNVSSDNYKWGGRIYHINLFSFNERNYMTVLSSLPTAKKYYISIVDRTNEGNMVGQGNASANVVFQDVIDEPKGELQVVNGNGTAGLAIYKTKNAEGLEELYLYGLMTSSGIACYKITNLAK